MLRTVYIYLLKTYIPHIITATIDTEKTPFLKTCAKLRVFIKNQITYSFNPQSKTN